MLENRKKLHAAILAGIFLIYLIFNGVLLMNHELWRDEANVWLMAKELTPSRLFAEIRYQGHPCLWYLLIMPFAKAGLPFRAIGFVSFSVMAGAAALFLWRSSFCWPVKLLVALSPIFTYFYSVIARNYCLIALLLMLLAWYYPRRNEKSAGYGLLLGLLVQADTIAIAQAGMISLMWLWENVLEGLKSRSFEPVKRCLGGIWIPLASLFLWIAQFYQVNDSPVFEMRAMGVREFFSEVGNFSYGIMSRMTGWGKTACLLFWILAAALALILSIRIKNGWAFCVMAASFLFQASFSAVVYQLHIWHYISLCFVFLWMIWCMDSQAKEKQAKDRVTRISLGILQALLLVLSVSMFLHWNSDEETSSLEQALHGCYSDGVNAAEYIKNHISGDELIISDDVPMASTVLAYLGDYEFYYAGNGRRESYADWSREQSGTITLEGLMEWVGTAFPEKRQVYLLMSENSCLRETDRLEECELLYRTEQKTVRGEEYRIYKVTLSQ